MTPESIDDIIQKLESIVEDAVADKDPIGIFAQLYLNVTRSVKEKIQQEYFEDGNRMERLDVIFAKRYLDALENYRKNENLSIAWKTAFNKARNNNLLTIQHLFMGMNTHINLDLGIAASVCVPPSRLKYLENDFLKINQLLVDNIEAVQEGLNRTSPLLFLLDWFGKKSDEKFAAFSLVKARAHAWNVALRLSKTPENLKDAEIIQLDGYVTTLNKLITNPGMLLGFLVKLIKWFESKDVVSVIQSLK